MRRALHFLAALQAVSADGFYYFLLVQKVTKKDTTSKNSKICYAPRSRANLALEILSSHRTWTAQRTIKLHR